MLGLRFCSLPLASLQRSQPVTVSWQAPPRPAGIPRAAVDLWWLDMRHGTPSEDFWATLSPDEQARAERFRFAQDRQRFVAGRGVLRRLIGRYLSLPPAEIGFTYNASGKPSVPGHPPAVPLEFNTSGSADVALYAFSGGGCVGVDVEEIRPSIDWAEIAATVFPPSEARYLARLPESDRCRMFYKHWTLREAFVKAQGVGLSVPLPHVDFTPWVRGDPVFLTDASGVRWSCLSFEPTENAVAALVVQA